MSLREVATCKVKRLRNVWRQRRIRRQQQLLHCTDETYAGPANDSLPRFSDLPPVDAEDRRSHELPAGPGGSSAVGLGAAETNRVYVSGDVEGQNL